MKFIRLLLLFVFCILTVTLFLWKCTTGVYLLLFVSIILYTAFRFSKKINGRLEFQKRQIDKKEEYLKELLHEKNWLLQEIQHRVKNNLQIVMSLLNSQSNYLKNKDALQAIHDSRNRIYSLSLIYQRLYEPGGFAYIAMHAYINELVAHLQDSFSSTAILFSINANEIFLNTSQATPIGLIINEAVTNAIKHAFIKNGQNAIIEVTFRKAECKVLELSIADNGRGLPDDFDIKNVTSLGMNLIKGLAEDIAGELSIYNDNGTVIKILFLEGEFNEIAAKEIK